MSEPSSSNALDDLLRDWSDAHRLSPAKQEDLAHRILAAATEVPRAGAVASSSCGWGVLVAAACVAACLVLFAVRLRPAAIIPNANNPNDTVALPARAVPNPQEVAARAWMFDLLSERFPNQLGWVAETDRELRLGLESSAGTETLPKEPVVVRLVVAQRNAHDNWEPIWNLDVTTRLGETVRLQLPQGDVALWTHRLPDGMIAIDTDLDWDGMARFVSSATQIQQTGVPALLPSHDSAPDRYRLFQTVVSEISG